MAKQAVDFQQATPPLDVTNPNHLPLGPYPRHLFKLAAKDARHSVIVAWDGDEPIANTFVDAIDAEAEAALVAKGYSLTPVLKAPKAAK